ncbi:MAG: glucokinase [Pseudomonadota bacterium]
MAPDRPEPAATLIPALATLVAEVAFAYWPEGGLVLNGSVARALLVGPRRDAFLAALPQGRAGVSLRDIPLALMADDAAALHGCRAILRAL